jgi:hypothetical protein
VRRAPTRTPLPPTSPPSFRIVCDETITPGHASPPFRIVSDELRPGGVSSQTIYDAARSDVGGISSLTIHEGWRHGCQRTGHRPNLDTPAAPTGGSPSARLGLLSIEKWRAADSEREGTTTLVIDEPSVVSVAALNPSAAEADTAVDR